MAERCANCGRPLLRSDPKCYHCNAPVIRPDQPDLPDALREAEPPVLDLSSVARHGATFLALVAIGLALLSWMGSGFRAEMSGTPAPAPPTGWREAKSSDGDFRIWLPTSWTGHTPTSPGWEQVTQRIAYPLPHTFWNTQPVRIQDRLRLVAQSDSWAGRPSLLVAVEWHPGLGRVDLPQLQHEDWTSPDLPAEPAPGASVVLRPTGEAVLTGEWICRAAATGTLTHTLTMIVPSDGGVYSVTVFGDVDRFLEEEETLWQILDSFVPASAAEEP